MRNIDVTDQIVDFEGEKQMNSAKLRVQALNWITEILYGQTLGIRDRGGPLEKDWIRFGIAFFLACIGISRRSLAVELEIWRKVREVIRWCSRLLSLSDGLRGMMTTNFNIDDIIRMKTQIYIRFKWLTRSRRIAGTSWEKKNQRTTDPAHPWKFSCARKMFFRTKPVLK